MPDGRPVSADDSAEHRGLLPARVPGCALLARLRSLPGPRRPGQDRRAAGAGAHRGQAVRGVPASPRAVDRRHRGAPSRGEVLQHLMRARSSPDLPHPLRLADSLQAVILEPALLDWLLDTDPALRWQVERDLAGAPAGGLAGDPGPRRHRGLRRASCSRCRIPTASGPAARTSRAASTSTAPRRPRARPAVDRDDLDAQHAARLGPRRRGAGRHRRQARREQPLGVRRPAVLGRRGRLLHQRLHARQRRLARRRRLGLAEWFLDHRLADGGWNCEWVEGSTRSSFHSTLNSLKGMLVLRGRDRRQRALRAARHAGEEYLLERRLLQPAVDGRARRAVGDAVRLPVPLALQRAERGRLLPRGRAARRRRARSAARRRDRGGPRRPAPDGTWLQERRHPGRVWFDVDVPAGEPSKWLTFYGTRVLDWWDEATRA